MPGLHLVGFGRAYHIRLGSFVFWLMKCKLVLGLWFDGRLELESGLSIMWLKL